MGFIMWQETLRLALMTRGVDYFYRLLAEECAELGQASLKYIRAREGDTPITEAEAREHVLEEIADAMNALDGVKQLLRPDELIAVKEIREEKQRRMQHRLWGGGGNAET